MNQYDFMRDDLKAFLIAVVAVIIFVIILAILAVIGIGILALWH